MNPMEFDDGRKGWYVKTPDFYCDIENDFDGKWSVYFRDKATGVGAYADQAEEIEQLPPHPPSRQCMCPFCIPSFDDRFSPPGYNKTLDKAISNTKLLPPQDPSNDPPTSF